MASFNLMDSGKQPGKCAVGLCRLCWLQGALLVGAGWHGRKPQAWEKSWASHQPFHDQMPQQEILYSSSLLPCTFIILLLEMPTFQIGEQDYGYAPT